MLKIHKKILLDEKQKPVAVQIPIEEFDLLEELIENYGLSKLMDEVKEDKRLSVAEAKSYYQSLKHSAISSAKGSARRYLPPLHNSQ
jgi:hypothetical protein